MEASSYGERIESVLGYLLQVPIYKMCIKERRFTASLLKKNQL